MFTHSAKPAVTGSVEQVSAWFWCKKIVCTKKFVISSLENLTGAAAVVCVRFPSLPHSGVPAPAVRSINKHESMTEIVTVSQYESPKLR